ncbi:hypothetical protein Ga0102493_11991 [Erythrobacter litoralis]|uniref:Uncharacterized protein n=1 Tax=Erythrobacter litoralis TaxID=39960 RepID=A0A074MT41_9SPHN|nr:hypothetical protein [Erythrobacter litoralis]AOL22020.1 hypothetical protein Ga0102493_11991 [Erythrobacter litoralis]KEO96639.1 hypothetical protein EH32_10450 [Erythrobacter litoralis]
MTQLSRIAQLAGLAGLASLFPAAPAAAQDAPGERVNMVIAYSEDECPEASDDNEIVICEILVEAERYRIPKNLRQSDSPENVSRAREVEKLKYVGAFGAMSCDPAGAGGFTGCTQRFIEAAYKDRSEAETVRFSQLIEEARQERLSTIDADAAAEQERVEMIEREYMQRLERERDGALPGEVDPTLSSPPVDMAERQPPIEPSKPGPFDDGDDEQVPLDAIQPAESGPGDR